MWKKYNSLKKKKKLSKDNNLITCFNPNLPDYLLSAPSSSVTLLLYVLRVQLTVF